MRASIHGRAASGATTGRGQVVDRSHNGVWEVDAILIDDIYETFSVGLQMCKYQSDGDTLGCTPWAWEWRPV